MCVYVRVFLKHSLSSIQRQTYKTDGPHTLVTRLTTIALNQNITASDTLKRTARKRQGNHFDFDRCYFPIFSWVLVVLMMAHRQGRSKSYCSSSNNSSSPIRLTCTARKTTTTVMLTTLCCCWCFGLLIQPASCGNPDAKRLYDDLLSNYNKIVRPVVNNSDVLKVRIKLKLSQLIDLASVLFFSLSLYPLFLFFQQLRKL